MAWPFFDGCHLYGMPIPAIGEHKGMGALDFSITAAMRFRNFLVANLILLV